MNYQPNQLAHIGNGCLGTEEDLRLYYGMKACNELADYYVMDIYNTVRRIIGLPIANEVVTFDSIQYCCERPILFKNDILKEYQLLLDFIIGVK